MQANRASIVTNGTSQNIDHLAPHNVEAEQAVLGAMFIEPNLLTDTDLTDDDFYILRHAWIWEALQTLHERGDPIDELTVSAELDDRGRLEEIGGMKYLYELQQKTPSALNADGYAHIVGQMAYRRRLISDASHLAQIAHSEAPIEDVQQQANGIALNVVERGGGSHKIENMLTIIADAENEIDDAQRGIQPNRYLWGIPSLDSYLVTEFGEYVAVCATTSTGKSAFVQWSSIHWAENYGPLLYVAMERRRARVALRFISQQADLPYKSLTEKNGLQTLQETWQQQQAAWFDDDADVPNPFDMKQEAATRLKELSVSNRLFMGYGDFSAEGLKSEVRRLVDLYGLKFVVIDTINRIQEARDKRGRYEGISNASDALSGIARDYGVTLIVLCQLNRDLFRTAPYTPQISHVRDTGAIVEHAGTVLMLHRPALFVEQGLMKASELDAHNMSMNDFWVYIGKSSEGEKLGKVRLQGTPSLRFYSPITTHVDLDEQLG